MDSDDVRRRLQEHFRKRAEAYEAAPLEEIHRLEAIALDRARQAILSGMLDHFERCLVPDKVLEDFALGYRDLAPMLAAKKWLEGGKVSLFLHGPSGLGKTMAATYALSRAQRTVQTRVHHLAERPLELPVLDWRRGLFLTARMTRDLPKTDWQAHEDNGGSPRRTRSGWKRRVSMETAYQVEWLVLDELGNESKDPGAKWDGRLGELLLERVDRKRRTVITSNLSLAGLKEWVANVPLFDRLTRDADVAEFEGESLRRNPSGLRLINRGDF